MLELIKNLVWSPITVVNIIALGIVLMLKTRFKAVIMLPRILRNALRSARRNKKSFSLMCTSLGGAIGVGNAIGVAGAIFEGGAGAVFWMAIAGFFGMVIKYTEVYLALKHGGPIEYIEKESGAKWIAALFSALCIMVSFGMGNSAQVRAAIGTVGDSVTAKAAASFIMALAFIYVSVGGIDKIRRFSQVAVPFASIAYIIAMTVIIIHRSEYIAESLKNILNGSGIFSGFKWALIKTGITSGFSKAIFSSEAGLGSAGFSHSESDEPPSEQAEWAIFEVFADTFICMMTAFALITFSSEISKIPVTAMTKGLFVYCFGNFGGIIYSMIMIIFAFSSIVCWYYNGSRSVKYLCKNKRVLTFYLITFSFLVFMSAFIGDGIVTVLSDIANGMMLTVNLCALWVFVFKKKLTF